jgi:hypothetical protein
MNLTQAAEDTIKREKQVVMGTQARPIRPQTRALHASNDVAQGGKASALAYVMAYHKIRAAAGFAGWILPFILIIGWGIAEHGWNVLKLRFDLQGSLSAYYHTGMRDFFVSILVVVGVLLVAYRLSDDAPDNRLGTWAGLAAIGVALVPTARDLDRHPNADLTAVQSILGERLAQFFHYGFAIGFIWCLFLISQFFAMLELAKVRNNYTSDDQRISSEKWSVIYRWMARAIAGAAVFIVIFQLLDLAHDKSWFEWGKENTFLEALKDYSILIGEVVAVLAFGVTWFIKGRDKSLLLADEANRGEQELDRDSEMHVETAPQY